MYDINMPILYTERPQDRRSDAYRRYDAMDFIDITHTVQEAGIDMGQEYILILAMEEGGLRPIQIRMPQDPDTQLARDIYMVALAIEATALVVFHNIPHGKASLENDLICYEKVKNDGDKIGIPLLDHIIMDGGMISGIYDTPIVAKRWKELVSVGCRLSRQLFLQNGEFYYIMSASLPGTIAGRKKPFTIGI